MEEENEPDYVMEGTTSSFKRLGRSVYTWHGEYDHNPVKEESRIKIENMQAAVLFLAVHNDDGWPSAEVVQRMVAILFPYGLMIHVL